MVTSPSGPPACTSRPVTTDHDATGQFMEDWWTARSTRAYDLWLSSPLSASGRPSSVRTKSGR